MFPQRFNTVIGIMLDLLVVWIQARSQDLCLGVLGERSEPTRPTQLRSERSAEAAAGVWGAAEGLGGAVPHNFLRNRVF